MDELSRYFPPGVKYDIPYDSSRFVSISIRQVVETLVEAVILVFLVMYLFLQNLRYTLIPTIVVPVALLGAFAVMFAFGYSINVLTMFAMVLAVGILVDDAIVVIENVERIMSEEGLSPRDATKKAMGQITAALIGISVTLVSVFLPMAFFAGSVGNIYRQFSLVMVSAMLFSVFLALSLTPALCATFLKPVEAGHKHEKARLLRLVQPRLQGDHARLRRLGRQDPASAPARFLMHLRADRRASSCCMFTRLPASFLPTEDQGYLIANVQLPPGATQARTLAVMQQVEGFFLRQPEVDKMVSVLGFSFSGSGQNAALAFVPLKPWDERKGAEHSAQALAGRAFGALRACATRSSSRSCRRRSPSSAPRPASRSACRTAAATATTRCSRRATSCSAWRRRARCSPACGPTAWRTRRSCSIDIDRDRASALGVSFDNINAVLSTALGSAYVNDFPNAGRLQRVVVQADAPDRMQPDDLLQLNVVNNQGKLVPMSALATTRWITGPIQTDPLQRLPVDAHRRRRRARLSAPATR